jgi:hypothetical protein
MNGDTVEEAEVGGDRGAAPSRKQMKPLEASNSLLQDIKLDEVDPLVRPARRGVLHGDGTVSRKKMAASTKGFLGWRLK